jgi:hypothetical protein
MTPVLLSRFLAFDDVHGHAARSRIPFDLTPYYLLVITLE